MMEDNLNYSTAMAELSEIAAAMENETIAVDELSGKENVPRNSLLSASKNLKQQRMTYAKYWVKMAKADLFLFCHLVAGGIAHIPFWKPKLLTCDSRCPSMRDTNFTSPAVTFSTKMLAIGVNLFSSVGTSVRHW